MTKTGKIYVYEGNRYSETELIDFAKTASHYDSLDSAASGDEPETINTIDEAIEYLGDVDVINAPKFADGGLVSGTPREYLNSIDRTKLPEKARLYLESEILNSDEIDVVASDDAVFLQLKAKLDAMLIDSGIGKPEPAGASGNETIAKLNQEIADLNELLEMEEDPNEITRLKQEIVDLNELIDLQ